MTFLSSRLRARLGSFAVACAVWLSASNVPLPTEAAAPQITSHLLTDISTPQGGTVRFQQLSDGSVAVFGNQRASAVTPGFGRATTPLELFHNLAPDQQAPNSLVESNARFLSARKSVGSLPRVHGSYRAAQAPAPPGPRAFRPEIANQWWFRGWCNLQGASYSVYYTPAWSWAYLDASGVSYGKACAYAINAPLQFTVNGNTMYVPPGWIAWATFYGFFSHFDARVSNAGLFDFGAAVWFTL